MRKFTSVLLMLLTLSVGAWADAFTPESGKKYSFKHNASGMYAYYNASNTVSSNVILHSAAVEDALTGLTAFDVTESANNSGYYTISITVDGTQYYVYTLDTNAGKNKVAVGTLSGDATDAYLWKFVEQGAGNRITPKSASNETYGWNFYGGYGTGSNQTTNVGLYNSASDAGNVWIISEAAEVNGNAYSTLETQAQTALSKSGVGYPTSSASSRSTLTSALSTEVSSPTFSDYATLYTAYNTYLKSTDDIEMPTDGKVYKIYFLVTQGGTNSKVYMAEQDNQTAKGTTTESAEYWVMQKVADTDNYRFASTSGKGTFTLTKNNSTYTDYTLKSAAGSGYQGGLGLYISKQNRYASFKNNTNADWMDGFYTQDKGTGGSWSTVAYFEEATKYQGHQVTFTNNQTDSKNYATLNLPFAVTIPTGVTAYKGTQNGEEVTLEALTYTDNVLPAETPVLLVNESSTSATFAPAAYVAASTDSNTGFTGTLAATAVTADNAYILAKGGDNNKLVKFYRLDSTNNTVNGNKAYFVASAGESAQALSFRFADTATGIASVNAEKQHKAWLYDLSGRRVLNPVKGGIYIQNGKKIIK